MVSDALKTLLNADLPLSRNFRIKEFFLSASAENRGIVNCPPTYTKLTKVLKNLQKLADILEIVRAANQSKPVFVTSGYRCPKLNELLQGHPFSYHMHGAAADITAKDFSYLAEACEWLYADSKDVDIDINREKKYVHIEINHFIR